MTFRTLLLPVSAVFIASCSEEPSGFIQFDTPPAVAIVDPLEGAIYDEGDTIVFRGRVSDNAGVADLDLRWASSIDGELLANDSPDANGAVELATASLSTGTHVVTLYATDINANQGEARVTIEIEGVPESPSISIEHPLPGETGLEDAPFRFVVQAEDAQDEETDLIVELESDVDGFVCAMQPDFIGIAFCEETLSFGEHLLTFTVTDTDELQNSASAVYQVVALGDFDNDRDGWTPNQGDCDDNNNTVHPGATEICDNIDNDCNAATPVDANTICYDDDGDGFCEAPPCRNAASNQPDCNDAAPGIYPGANEIPDGVDNDCDGVADDGQTNFDDDGDGYCETPPCINASGTESDCDDGRFLVNPGQTEICGDGLDNNCNFTQNEQNALQCTNFYVDEDGDGYGVNGPRECWCEAGPDSWPYGATNTNDCYDNNIEANPGQTQYFNAHRGDGSFDYNCRGGSEIYPPWDTTIGCDSSWGGLSCSARGDGGYLNNVPSCGQTAPWADDCDSCTVILALCIGGNIAIGSDLIPCDTLCPTALSCTIDANGAQSRRMKCR